MTKKDRPWIKYLVSATLTIVGPLHPVSAEENTAEPPNIESGVVMPAGSAPEALVYDDKTGDYILTYKTTDIRDNEILVRMVFEPKTKIDPSIVSKFEERSRQGFVYKYKVHNGKHSKQALDGLLLFVDHASALSGGTPHGWKGYVFSDLVDNNVSVSWDFAAQNGGALGLLPGRTQDGFAFQSPDLPGIGVIRLTGAIDKVFAYTGGGPQGDVGEAFYAIEKNNFVGRPVAVPKIPIPNPFHAGPILEALQKHIKEDLVGIASLDASFAEQLDRSLATAVEAARRGNRDSLRAQLKDVRRMLKREHGDLDDEDNADHEDDDKGHKKSIDKLAARVLDFDIKYVLKQVSPSGKDS